MNNTKNDIVSEKDRNNKNNQVDELLRIYIYLVVIIIKMNSVLIKNL